MLEEMELSMGQTSKLSKIAQSSKQERSKLWQTRQSIPKMLQKPVKTHYEEVSYRMHDKSTTEQN